MENLSQKMEELSSQEKRDEEIAGLTEDSNSGSQTGFGHQKSEDKVEVVLSTPPSAEGIYFG